MKFIYKIAFALMAILTTPNIYSHIIQITTYTSPQEVKDKVIVFLNALRQAAHYLPNQQIAKLLIISEVIDDWTDALNMTEDERQGLTEITEKEIRLPDGSLDQHITTQYLFVKPDQTVWTDYEITDFVAFATAAKNQCSQDLGIVQP
jgi:hypothetical protein